VLITIRSASRFTHPQKLRVGMCGLAALCAALGGFTACSSPGKENIEVYGVQFSRAKIDGRGFVIGYLAGDSTIAGRACKQGWVHLHPNGVPAGFTAASDIVLSRFIIPSNTWVFQNEEGTVTQCAFPRDTGVQGQVCRGGGILGGAEGVQTAFYPDGALKQFFARKPVRIDGVPCGNSLFQAGIELHENGRLRSATLSEDYVRQGRVYHRGERIHLTPEGLPGG